MSPNGLWTCAQLRHVLDRRIVERQQPAVAQLHDRDAGERLGDRGPVEDGFFVDAALRRAILVALERLVRRLGRP